MGAIHQVCVFAAVRAGALFWVMTLTEILVFIGILTTETRFLPAFSRYPALLAFTFGSVNTWEGLVSSDATAAYAITLAGL